MAKGRFPIVDVYNQYHLRPKQPMDKSTFRKNQMYIKDFQPLGVANVAPLFLNLFTVIVWPKTTSSLANAQDEMVPGAHA
jgi:hypothetical protein